MQGTPAKSIQSSGASTAAPIYPERRQTYDFYPKPREKVISGFPSPLAARVLGDGSFSAIVSGNRMQLYNLSTNQREYSVIFEDSQTSEPVRTLYLSPQPQTTESDLFRGISFLAGSPFVVVLEP
jgi:hypothetical protein